MKKTIYALMILSFAALWSGCKSSDKRETTHKADSHHHEEREEGDALELSQQQIEAVDIQFGELSYLSLGNIIKATGTLAVDAQNEAVVSPLVPGVVKSLLVKVGDHVSQGTVIAYTENLDAIGLQQDYLLAKEEEALARKELQRQEVLAKEGAGVRKNLEQAQSALQMASTKVAGLAQQLASRGINAASVKVGGMVTETAVTSSMAGVVSEVMASPGSYADLQSPIIKVVNNGALYCSLNIFEKDIPEVRAGQKVELYLTNRPDATFEGRVTGLTDVMNLDTKSIAARVQIISGNTSLLVPGMSVTGNILADTTETEALPDEAIVTAEGKSYVFAVEGTENEDGKLMTHFRKMEVVTGTREHGYTQVKFIDTPAPGTRFVVKNAFYLGSMTSEHGEHSH